MFYDVLLAMTFKEDFNIFHCDVGRMGDVIEQMFCPCP